MRILVCGKIVRDRRPGTAGTIGELEPPGDYTFGILSSASIWTSFCGKQTRLQFSLLRRGRGLHTSDFRQDVWDIWNPYNGYTSISLRSSGYSNSPATLRWCHLGFPLLKPRVDARCCGPRCNDPSNIPTPSWISQTRWTVIPPKDSNRDMIWRNLPP